MTKTIVLASNNSGKIQEFEQILSSLDWNIKPQAAFAIPEAAETGKTFVENAIIKARNACEHSKLASIADDSGIEVDALCGKPGVYSARYAGEKASAEQNMQTLLDNLIAIPPEQRQARFHCVIVFLKHADDPTPIIAQASWEGQILNKPQGQQGHGYDPIFYIPELNCSAAELSLAEKNQISHRGKALALLLKRLKAGE